MGTFLRDRKLQSASTGIVIPTGSAAQRPDFPVFGMIRYNTTISTVEIYGTNGWASIT